MQSVTAHIVPVPTQCRGINLEVFAEIAVGTIVFTENYLLAKL